MDPITIAIITALSTAATDGLTEVSKAAINQAYERIKALIAHKFGKTSEVASAVEHVEAKPGSAGRQATLHEEVMAAGVHQDTDVLQAAQQILQLIQNAGGAGPHTQTATGNYIAQADRGSSASVQVTGKDEP